MEAVEELAVVEVLADLLLLSETVPKIETATIKTIIPAPITPKNFGLAFMDSIVFFAKERFLFRLAKLSMSDLSSMFLSITGAPHSLRTLDKTMRLLSTPHYKICNSFLSSFLIIYDR